MNLDETGRREKRREVIEGRKAEFGREGGGGTRDGRSAELFGFISPALKLSGPPPVHFLSATPLATQRTQRTTLHRHMPFSLPTTAAVE